MPAKRQKRNKAVDEIESITLQIGNSKPLPIIKVVGISGSGKSTLVAALRANGYDARPVSQEHSNVPTLWQHFERAAYVICLYASLEVQQARRQDVAWSAAAHKEEIRRIAHAREHAELRINTDGLTPKEVYEITLSYLSRRRVRHADQALASVPATGSATKPSSAENENH